MSEYRVHRPDLRFLFVAMLSIAGIVISLLVFHSQLAASLFIGCLFGNLLSLIRRPVASLKPIGKGWKIVWVICVLLAVAGFVAAFFDWPTVGFGALFTIVALWGWFIHRYTNRVLQAR